MNYKSRIFLFAVALLATANCVAQPTLKTSKDSTSSKLSISEETGVKKKKKKVDKNIFKLNPLLFAQGEIPFTYEHWLKVNRSYELTVGLTTRNLFKDHLGFLTAPGDVYAQNFDQFYLSGMKPQLGFSGKAAYRFYFDSKESYPAGSYISPELRVKSYRFNTSIDTTSTVGPVTYYKVPFKGLSRTYFDLLVNYGTQEQWEGRVYYDFFVGAGARFKSEDNLTVEEGFNFPVLARSNKVVPLFVLGVKFGVSFK